MVYGIRRNPKLSGLWNVDDDVVLCFPSLMLCPYIDIKKKAQRDNAKGGHDTIDKNSKAGHGTIVTPSITIRKDEEYDIMPANTQVDLDDTGFQEDQTDTRQSIQLQSFTPMQRSATVCGRTALNEQVSGIEEKYDNPSVDILRHNMQPSGDTMAWFENQWGIDAKVVMGIFVILRIAEKQHNHYLEHITTAVLQITNLDLKHTAYCTALVKLFSSADKKTVKDAQEVLGLTFRELSMVAKRLKDPKSIDTLTMKELNFSLNDNLNTSRDRLTWKDEPELCENWCKETARAVFNNAKLKPRVKFMATGQLLMAIQLPPVFIQGLLQHCQAEESHISAFKALLKGNYIKTMSSKSSQKNAIEQLSRLFDIPHDQMKAFVYVALAPGRKEREDHITKLLQSSSFTTLNEQKEVMNAATKAGEDKKMISKIKSIVKDARQYMKTLEDNVMNFSQIGAKLHLPAVFIESLCSGMN